jgi:hypothetical protein
MNILNGTEEQLKPNSLKVLDLVKDCFYFKEYIGTVIHNLIKTLEHCEYRE